MCGHQIDFRVFPLPTQRGTSCFLLSTRENCTNDVYVSISLSRKCYRSSAYIYFVQKIFKGRKENLFLTADTVHCDVFFCCLRISTCDSQAAAIEMLPETWGSAVDCYSLTFPFTTACQILEFRRTLKFSDSPTERKQFSSWNDREYILIQLEHALPPN